jgi:hypothetical protein
MRALVPTLLVGVSATLWRAVAALGADPAVVEIGMINQPDGSQFMTLSRGSVLPGLSCSGS